MTDLIVCCDGTWNTPDQEDDGRLAPTNVFKIRNALAATNADGEPQIAYYRPGVGTSGGRIRRLLGGSFGIGLSDDVKSAYKWLCESYAPGRRIFLFGFSRGAFAVRSLAGLMGRCSLLDFADDPDDATKWARVEAAYRAYRNRRAPEGFRAAYTVHPGVEIDFLGVWDTVGALGIPDETVFEIFDRPWRYRFHDTRLGEMVKVARHAMSIDERRQTFTPTLWSDVPESRDVRQVWFAGVHGDIGGGYAETGLGDITLRWMMDEAAGQGLRFRESVMDEIRPNPQGRLHDSFSGVFAHFRTRPRNTPNLADTTARIHDSVHDRRAHAPLIQPAYWPTRSLAAGDEPLSLRIWAKDRWNATGLYLEEGASYDFAASGEWLDSRIKSGPAGTGDRRFQPGEVAHVLSNGLSWAERAWRSFAGTPATQWEWTRREDRLPWMSLVGVVANGAGVDPKTRRAAAHQVFPIGAGTRLTVERPGYLYAFANDAWRFYENNKGGVTLTITRTA